MRGDYNVDMVFLVKSVKESRIKENFGALRVKLDTHDISALNGIKTRRRYLLHSLGSENWSRSERFMGWRTSRMIKLKQKIILR